MFRTGPVLLVYLSGSFRTHFNDQNILFSSYEKFNRVNDQEYIYLKLMGLIGCVMSVHFFLEMFFEIVFIDIWSMVRDFAMIEVFYELYKMNVSSLKWDLKAQGKNNRGRYFLHLDGTAFSCFLCFFNRAFNYYFLT